LEVYQTAIRFVTLADQISQSVPRKHTHCADQLHRASTSVVLNIAEGAGEFSRKDKARFYRIALRSVTECAAVLDVLLCLKVIEAQPAEQGKDLLHRIVSMLTRLVRNLQPRSLHGEEA
jgi:four helix bundle protein